MTPLGSRVSFTLADLSGTRDLIGASIFLFLFLLPDMTLSRTNDGMVEGPRKRTKYDQSANEVAPTVAKELRTIKASLSDSNPQNVISGSV